MGCGDSWACRRIMPKDGQPKVPVIRDDLVRRRSIEGLRRRTSVRREDRQSNTSQRGGSVAGSRSRRVSTEGLRRRKSTGNAGRQSKKGKQGFATGTARQSTDTVKRRAAAR